SGMIMPIMQWVNWLGYVGIAVAGGLRVANGQMTLGAVTAFIQYSREFNQPLGQIAGMSNMLISGVASAERIFELLDEPEETPDGTPARTPEGAFVRETAPSEGAFVRETAPSEGTFV
ncbi:ABC transporter ATP-binding protein, partial [Aquicoccus sp. SCR17]|nr:ABC transporter ATP-binding protein [Carideicomes alvinocaridis]